MKSTVANAGLLRTITVALLLLTVMVVAPTTEAASKAQESGQWCGTQIIYMEKLKNLGGDDDTKSPEACTVRGPCDDPGTRAAWIPDSTDPITYVRLVVHVLRNDDGSNAISSEAEVNSNIANLNADYLPYRIQFEHTINWVNSSAWRVLSEAEIDAMKIGTALKPDSQLNVWVTQVSFDYSFGTFPWDTDALTSTGGIVMGHFHWGSSNSVLAHEVGHCIGLYHTFNGVEEVSQCGACYESPNGADNDVRGDRCDDTPPHPLTYSCSNVGGTDPCSGQAWGYTMPENFMGYSPTWCYSLFTPKQAGRFHCWLNDRLADWIVGVNFSATNTFGPAPLEVTFLPQTNKTVSSWDWDFGDGESSGDPAPVHMYEAPGYFDVSVTIQTPDGPYANVQAGVVSAYADTMWFEDAEIESGQPIKVDLYATNFIPLKQIEIPFGWTGALGLQFDSFSTAGLRTDYFQDKRTLNYDIFGKRAAVILNSSVSGAVAPLPPGTGPIMTLHFSGGTVTEENPIVLTSYASFSPEFTAGAGVYAPVTADGSISPAGCCVDARGNIQLEGSCNPADQSVDVGDLTNLIDHLFISFTPICCEDEADVSPVPGDGSVDVGDLTGLIDHLFISFPPLQVCN
ncbi:MAG: PKD domain-containing protein [candidate division Zixibacteria bacterium]|nr:PKD domain-containing protein [candidate division Zixibacteria bacterium]